MNRSPVLAAALAVVAVAGGRAGATPREARDEDVLITEVGKDPCCGSGVIAFAVGIRGRVGGEDRSYFIPFMTIGQPKPRVGEHCTIDWHWWEDRSSWLLGDGTSLFRGRLVTRFRCGGTSGRY